MNQVPLKEWMDALVSAVNELATTSLGFEEGSDVLDRSGRLGTDAAPNDLAVLDPHLATADEPVTRSHDRRIRSDWLRHVSALRRRSGILDSAER